MSLYLTLAVVIAVAVFVRIRIGAQVIPYAVAALLVVLFLFTPGKFFPGIGRAGAPGVINPVQSVEQLGDILGFALLVLAAWIGGTSRRAP